MVEYYCSLHTMQHGVLSSAGGCCPPAPELLSLFPAGSTPRNFRHAPKQLRAMSKKLHQRKEINAVLLEAIEAGWRYEQGRGHGGLLWCPCGNCMKSVPGTPRNDVQAARRLRAAMRRCPAQKGPS